MTERGRLSVSPQVGDIWRPIVGSGRLWQVARIVGDEITLHPLGGDVRPAQVGNRMNGGVRSIRRTEGVLLGRWTLVEGR